MLKFKKSPYNTLALLSILFPCYLTALNSESFSLEHARTDEQIQWGLMQRRTLPENQGMLFHFSKPEKVEFWSFNCYIDLSLAFIDEQKKLREIKPLKSFPEKMDPARPVFSNKDFYLYSAKGDPVVSFFQKNTVTASSPVTYVLEMNIGWFEKNNVQVGDVLEWDDETNKAFFKKISRDESVAKKPTL